MDVDLRTPVEIRARILIVSAIFRRLALENAPLDEEEDPLADAFDEREWLREQGLARQLTARETALLDSPLGSIAPELTIEASWQGEALSALAWAVDAMPMPSGHESAHPRPIMVRVPRPWDAIRAWVSQAAIGSPFAALHE